jgi:hypothetical protein
MLRGMKSSTARVVVTVALVALALPGCKRLASALGKQEPLVDHDYQFRLASPGRSWRLLGEAEASHIVPDAIAGAALSGSGTKSQYTVVIVERYSGALDGYVDLLMQGSAIENKKIESREKIEFQKHPAVRTLTRGSVNGLKVVFRHLIFLNHGFGYQLASWGMEGQVDLATLGTAESYFELLDGPVRGRTSRNAVTEARGPGWRLHDGSFRSAAWGIEVAPPSNTRIVVGAELAAMNSSADVGLISSQPETYLVALAERASGVDPHALAKQRMAENVASIQLEPDEGTLTATVLGQTVTLQRYRPKAQPFVYYQGAAIHDGAVVVLLGWHVRGKQEPSVQALVASLTSIKPLAPAARQALASELAGMPEVQNAVGVDYALRRGTYRDFAQGLTWKLPAGPFRIQVGTAARAINEQSRLIVDEVGTGLGGLLLSEDSNGMDGKLYHAVATAESYTLVKGRAPRPRAVQIAGIAQALSTIGPAIIAGTPMLKQTVSWVDNNRAFQVLIWAPQADAQRAQSRFSELLAGLTPGQVKPSTVTGQTYADHRLGFAFAPPTVPGGPWTRADVTPKEIAPIGTTIEWKNARYSVAVLSLFGMDTRLSEEDFVSRFRRQGSELPLLSSATITTDSLAGLAGKRIRTGVLAATKLDVTVVRRDGTFYGLMVQPLSGDVADADREAMKAGFRLLD